MAKYADGTNYAKSIDPSSANILDPGVFGGKVRVMQDTAVISASANLNSTDYIIVGGKLPAGAQVVKILLGVPATTALSSSGLVVIGDEGSANRYSAGFQTTTAAVHVGPDAVGGMQYAVTGTTDNYIRIAGSATQTRISTNTLKITIFYIVE